MTGRFARMPAIFALTIFLPIHAFAAEPVHKPDHHRPKQHEAASKQAISEAVRNQIAAAWLLPAGLAGVEKVRISARLRLDSSGNLKGAPAITASGGPDDTRKVLIASVARSIVRAAPFKGLPRDRYNDWREMVLNFNAAL